jgi:hypothetical protein
VLAKNIRKWGWGERGGYPLFENLLNVMHYRRHKKLSASGEKTLKVHIKT